MLEMTSLLVTGVGGGVGLSIVKALAGSQLRIVGVDADEYASGLQAVPVAYRVPRADQPGYVETLLEICRKEQCRILFPGLDPELPRLAEAISRFEEVGTKVVVSDPEVVRVADDKLATAQLLAAGGLEFPDTSLLSEGVDLSRLPVVLKPRFGGSRSAGVFVARTADDLTKALNLADQRNCVVQEYLPGDEYTCGTVNFDGICHGPIIMRRTLRSGDTHRAEVIFDDKIGAYVREVASLLRPFGPCNFQLRLRNGMPVLFEINPRCSGTTAARALAGFNEPEMVANYLLSEETPTYSIKRLLVLRYLTELVASPDRLKGLSAGSRSTGTPWRL